MGGALLNSAIMLSLLMPPPPPPAFCPSVEAVLKVNSLRTSALEAGLLTLFPALFGVFAAEELFEAAVVTPTKSSNSVALPPLSVLAPKHNKSFARPGVGLAGAGTACFCGCCCCCEGGDPKLRRSNEASTLLDFLLLLFLDASLAEGGGGLTGSFLGFSLFAGLCRSLIKIGIHAYLSKDP